LLEGVEALKNDSNEKRRCELLEMKWLREKYGDEKGEG